MQKIRRLSFSIALIAALGLTACASLPKTAPVPPPTQVEQLSLVDQVRRVAESVVDSVAKVQQGEADYYDLRKADGSRLISPQRHYDNQDIFKEFASETRAALKELRDLASTPQTVRSAAQKVIDIAKAKLTTLKAVSPEIKLSIDGALVLIEAFVLPRL